MAGSSCCCHGRELPIVSPWSLSLVCVAPVDKGGQYTVINSAVALWKREEWGLWIPPSALNNASFSGSWHCSGRRDVEIDWFCHRSSEGVPPPTPASPDFPLDDSNCSCELFEMCDRGDLCMSCKSEVWRATFEKCLSYFRQRRCLEYWEGMRILFSWGREVGGRGGGGWSRWLQSSKILVISGYKLQKVADTHEMDWNWCVCTVFACMSAIDSGFTHWGQVGVARRSKSQRLLVRPAAFWGLHVSVSEVVHCALSRLWLRKSSDCLLRALELKLPNGSAVRSLQARRAQTFPCACLLQSDRYITLSRAVKSTNMSRLWISCRNFKDNLYFNFKDSQS